MPPKVEPRQQMPMISIEERKTSFSPLYRGFTEEMALAEAKRCISCKKPMCKEKGCPLSNRIPEWIALIKEGKFMEAAALTRETSSMPEICSRVCPQDRLCEGKCALGIKNEPVAIGALERFANDYAREHGDIPIKAGAQKGKSVAIVGAGPAGLAVAEQLLTFGYTPVLHDSLGEPGGLLIAGLPGFKISREIVGARWKLLEAAGARFKGGQTLGKDFSLDSLMKDSYAAVFLGVGTWTPSVPKLPGLDAEGVVQALHFLRGAKDGIPVKGKTVVVLGGGDTAMDCARTAIRRGAKKATIAYRRDEANAPGSKKEVKAARDEGVEFIFLITPVKFIANGNGKLTAIRFQKMELGEPDAEGRRSPKPVPDSFFEMQADFAVPAFGFKLDSSWANDKAGVEFNQWGNFLVNPETGATSRRGVFAGGDCTLGADLVVRAVLAGRRAAAGINRYLTDGNWEVLAPTPQGAK